MINRAIVIMHACDWAIAVPISSSIVAVSTRNTYTIYITTPKIINENETNKMFFKEMKTKHVIDDADG